MHNIQYIGTIIHNTLINFRDFQCLSYMQLRKHKDLLLSNL